MAKTSRRKISPYIKLWLLVIAISTVTVFAVVKLYEDRASKNILVNIAKRTAAEAGSFFVRYVYDPVPDEDRKSNAYFGPKDNPGNNQNVVTDPEYFLQGVGIEVTKFVNNMPSKYAKNFDYQPFVSDKLTQLREKYRLQELTNNLSGEFEKIVFLKDWLRKKIPRGSPKNVDYNFNALDILSRAENGETFFCSEYSTVFVQLVSAVGLIGRYVGLFKGHVVAEIWSNEFTKWVVMDVDNNLHYEKNGIPLDSLELHDIWESKDFVGLKAVKGIERNIIDETVTETRLSYYHEFYVRMRNDWFSNRYPHWHPKANSIMNGLEWQDTFTKNNILVANEVYDKDILYFPLNVTSLGISGFAQPSNRLKLVFNTYTPGFSHFVIEVDGGTPFKYKSSLYDWNIHKGVNQIKIRAVNILGIKGPESMIELKLNSN